MKELMSPKQVALAFGVSETSLKRWCDRGIIPAIRTAGGHRRLPVNGVMQFIRQTGQRVVRPEALGLPPSSGQDEFGQERIRDLLRMALERGDEEQCRRLMMNLVVDGSRLHEICDLVIAPAFRDIGERWRRGHVEVYQEHRAVEICTRILHDFRLLLPTAAEGAFTAIGSTLDGDPYALASTMVELSLLEAGWSALWYGSGNPAGTLVAAIEETQPRLFWLSVSVIQNVPCFVEQCRRLFEATTAYGGAFVVGGRALVPGIRERIPYSACCDRLEHLMAFVSTLRSAGRH